LSPHFTVIDERTAEGLLDDAIEAVMRNAAGDPVLGRAFATLAVESAETSFRKLIRGFVQNRRGILEALARSGSMARLIAETWRALGADARESVGALVAAAVAERAFDREGIVRLAAAAERGSATEQKKAEVWRRFLAEAAGRVNLFADYAACFFTQKGEPQKNVLNPSTLSRHPGLDAVIAAELARLQALDARIRLNRVARRTEALIVAGFAVNAAYARKKQSSGRLDYEDLILESAALLHREGIAPWVLYKLDGGIDHVLVDEAQDTNRAQWRLVNKLTEEFPVGESARSGFIRTVFAVGDVKQSIFRFQGAEPEVFVRQREHYRERSAFGRIEFLDWKLTLSFRSTKAVLDLVDAVIAAPLARVGLAEGNEDIHHKLRRVGEAGRVELWEPEGPGEKEPPIAGWRLPLAQKFEATPEAKLAKRIADKIAALLAETARDERPIRPGDILVLVRQRTDFNAHLIRELKAGAIPVAGADRMKLHEQISIQDLLASARFALLPEDDLTLACVLKGPFIGLDEEALYRLCRDRRGSLWDVLKKEAKGNADLEEAERFLSGLLRGADFTAPFDFFAAILQEKGGRQKLIRRLGAEVNDPVDEFLSLSLAFEKENPPSLQGFLRWFAESETEIKRDLERGADEVRVMTVHGAKGLQAPVVFLPDTCRKPPERIANLIEFRAEESEASLFAWIGAAKNALGPLAEAHAEALRRQREEHNRLLYVALTRAEDRLYIGGCRNRAGHEIPEDAWYPMIREAFKTMPGVAEEKDAEGRPILVLENPGAAAKTREVLRPVPEAVALPAWAKAAAPAEKPPLRPLRPSGTGIGVGALSPAARLRALKRGEIVHKLLEFLPDIPPRERIDAAERFLKHPAFRLPARERKDICALVLRLLSHPRFRVLFGPGSRAEAAIAGEVRGGRVSGQVDRLWVGEKEVFIADYKTNRAIPKTAAGAPSAYLAQLSLYAELLSGIYPRKKIRAALVWVEDARLMEIPDKILKSARP